MSNPGFSEDLQIEAAEAFKRYGSKREAARAIGVEESSFYRRLNAATKSGFLGPARTKPGFVIRSISSKEGDAWVKQVPEPGEEFAVPDGHIVKGVSERHGGVDISKGNATGSQEHAAKEHGFSLREALADDTAWICKVATAIAMLPGWENSKGARAEWHLSLALGHEVMYL